jgi:hypothetical protein
MTLIENAARSLCRIHGDSEDDRATGAPRWMAYLPHVLAVIEALHDPNDAMSAKTNPTSAIKATPAMSGAS